MAKQYTQSVTSSKTRFTAAPMAEIEFSTLRDDPTLLTTFNGGDIVPIYLAEVLPHDTFKVDLDFVIRQTTSIAPVMGQLKVDFYAFFVPNRIVNRSWKSVMGENVSGKWTAPAVSLAPLCTINQFTSTGNRQIPVGSVADYYGLPTQSPIPVSVLSQMHDLPFRGYLEIYNTYFRDENYQPPIPYSKLNIYNGFLESKENTVYYNPENPAGRISLTGKTGDTTASGNAIARGQVADNTYGAGAVLNALYGDGSKAVSGDSIAVHAPGFSILQAPLKANKLHDYFTSVLPSPQKGREVSIPVLGEIPLNTSSLSRYSEFDGNLVFGTQFSPGPAGAGKTYAVGLYYNDIANNSGELEVIPNQYTADSFGSVDSSNLYADLSNSGVSISVSDLRLSSAIQRVYEILGNGGSRYTEFVNSFFGLEVDNPYEDIPTFLGHFSRDLDLYQTAQTSATPDGDGTPQGTLTAFGYTNKSGALFTKTFNEHGYVHIFAVVRHHNVYSTLLDRHYFRMSMLDFYSYPLANISEQPVYTRQINPFLTESDGVFGYQEAWAEYRFEPSRTSALMRNGVQGSLSMWNYADNYDSGLQIADGEWIKSNTAEVVNRSTAVTEKTAPQFKGQFMFHITKERPMPVYSVPGADIF